MTLDPNTLGLIFVLLAFVLGGLLLLSWALNREVRSLGWWGSAFVLVSIGMSLVSLGQGSPSGRVLILANGLVALAYGCQYIGCRVFNRRSASIGTGCIGLALWLVAWPFIGEWFLARFLMMSVIISGYTCMSAWELWQHARTRLTSQLLAIILLLGSAGFHLSRGVLSLVQTTHPWIDAWTSRWSAEVAFVFLLYIPVLAFVYLSMAKERIEEDYRQAAIRLQESETRFRDYAEVAADWLWELDQDLNFTRLTGRKAQAFGRPVAEVLGQSIRSLITAGATDDASTRALEHFQAREPFRDLESHLKDPDGVSRWLSSSARPLFDHAGRFTGYRGVTTDLTEHRRLEAQLVQAQKMEAIGQLTGGLAHDFNNLLGIIIGNLDFLKDRLDADIEAREALDESLEAAWRGANLNRSLLAFARRQPLKPRRLDVNELVRNTARLLGRALGETIDLRLSLAPNPGTVLADPAQLEAAITNLLVNARDAMPEGGRLIITTENLRFHEDSGPDHADVTPGHYVLIEVTDSGSGIGSENLYRVFEPFFTTKEGKGTGLGLSQVLGFIRQSGGHVRISSEVGSGTTVRLYLPVLADEGWTAEPQPESLDRVAQPGTREVILAVEDNEALRRVLVKQLRDLGYNVLQASTGEAALEILRTDTRIDLLLTDIVMPGGLNGYELAREALKARPDLKLLYTSGFPEAAFGREGELRPGDLLLGKPYRSEELARSLREALGASPAA